MSAEGLNKVLLIGNLGMDPELKYTQTGQAVMRMRLATTERWGDKGEKKERTEWHTVIVWGNRGEALSKILHKGRTIYVEGRIQTREWEDKEGAKKYSTEIVANQVLLLGGGKPNEERQQFRGNAPGAKPAAPPAQEDAPDVSADDLGF